MRSASRFWNPSYPVSSSIDCPEGETYSVALPPSTSMAYTLNSCAAQVSAHIPRSRILFIDPPMVESPMHDGGDLRRHPRVGLRQRDIGAQTPPPGQLHNARQDVRRNRLALDAVTFRFAHRRI